MLTFKDFEAFFSHQVPSYGMQGETQLIMKVREWMFQRQYSTQTAFERLVRSVDRFQQYSFRRVDFHKAFVVNRVGLTAPEIDTLYDILSNGLNVEITIDHWSSKIYDDVTNPL